MRISDTKSAAQLPVPKESWNNYIIVLYAGGPHLSLDSWAVLQSHLSKCRLDKKLPIDRGDWLRHKCLVVFCCTKDFMANTLTCVFATVLKAASRFLNMTKSAESCRLWAKTYRISVGAESEIVEHVQSHACLCIKSSTCHYVLFAFFKTLPLSWSELIGIPFGAMFAPVFGGHIENKFIMAATLQRQSQSYNALRTRERWFADFIWLSSLKTWIPLEPIIILKYWLFVEETQ